MLHDVETESHLTWTVYLLRKKISERMVEVS